MEYYRIMTKIVIVQKEKQWYKKGQEIVLKVIGFPAKCK